MINKRYWVEESYLTSMADVIRNKTGLTNKLTFPDQFFEGIKNIETSPETALPVLDMNYPEDVTVVEGASVSASFTVVISEPGIPATYTYQWYFNGKAVDGANSSSFFINQEIAKGTYNVYCEVTNEAGTVTSRIGSLMVESYLPEFTYNGTYELIEDDNYNWRIKFLTSGTLTFNKDTGYLDVFLVGGGGKGGSLKSSSGGAGGGGGGRTLTASYLPTKDVEYSIVIGGSAGNTEAFGSTAKCGENGSSSGGGDGGSGGGARGSKGGTNGGDGSSRDGEENNIGYGQGTNTYEFGEKGSTLYSGGGGGGAWGGNSTNYGDAGDETAGSGGGSNGKAGIANRGGGGGGGTTGGNGGSGIVIIRNHRS